MAEQEYQPEDNTILVADNSEDSRHLIVAMLEKKGYSVKTTDSGERTIEMLRTNKPDLILLDTHLPDQDGFETARQIRNSPKWWSLPIIFMSAVNDTDNIVQCFEAGGVDYIPKPFQKDEFYARIHAHLGIVNLENKMRVERDKINSILTNILPANLVEKIKQGIKPEPEVYEDVAVIFTDFQNFTARTKEMGPSQSIHYLNSIFHAFDEVIQHFGLERIKTIGDAYMAVSGVNTASDSPALRAVLSALKLQEFIEHYNRQTEAPAWNLRIGIHYGTVIAGIIGSQKIAFDVWGDTVNVANRLESLGPPGGINISDNLYQKVSHVINCQESRVCNLEHWGELTVHYCNGLSSQAPREISQWYHALNPEQLMTVEQSKQVLLDQIMNFSSRKV